MTIGGVTPLSLPPRYDYIPCAGLPAMAINALWNKRSGPGGSARRLHQFPVSPATITGNLIGGETGSTRVVKAWFSPGMVPPLSGRFTDANDNEAFAVAA